MMLWSRRKRVYVDALPQTHDLRFLVVLLAMVVGLFGGLYVVGYVVAGDKVPPRTKVAGTEIGGMSRAEAKEALLRAVAVDLHRPMTVIVAGRSTTMVPAASGVSVDADATVTKAMGGSDADPAHMLKVVEGGDTVTPILRVDSSTLQAALASLAAKVESAPVDSTLSLVAGRPVVHLGHDGGRLDVTRTAESVVAAIQAGKTSVHVRLIPVPANVSPDVVTAFVDNTVKPAIGGPVTVVVARKALTVTPAQFAPAMRLSGSGGDLRLAISPSVLYQRTKAVLDSLPGRPVDARMTFQSGHPVVLASHPGHTVTPAAWAKAVFAAATGGGERRATAKVVAAAPPFTTADAHALQISRNLSSVTATADAQLMGPLSLAAHGLDAHVVLPGVTFSYDRAVGQVSASTVLSPLGGATESAAEQAGLTITRWPAVSPVGHDLQFRNDSSRAVLLHAWVTRGLDGRAVTHVQLWGSPAP